MIPDWLWRAKQRKVEGVRDAQEKGVTINTNGDINREELLYGER